MRKEHWQWLQLQALFGNGMISAFFGPEIKLELTKMPKEYQCRLLIFLLLVIPIGTIAEGTREIMHNPSHNGRILFDGEFGGFGQFNAHPNDRMHIRIKEPGEKIYYGFGTSILSDGWGQYPSNDVYYRIVGPDGIVVLDTRPQPQGGVGFIQSYLQAISGPDTFDPLGYSPLELSCAKAGDYYVEFIFEDASAGGRREFDFFDITVADVNNQPVAGRVWSKAWMFTVSEKGGQPYSNPFYGKVYILSDDGIVTSCDFNGMRPFVFTMFANPTGVKNSGDPVADRKSVHDYKVTYPQYKVFLNDPDPACFPTGSIGEFASPATITGSDPPYCINVNPTKPGAVQVLIDLNGIKGYQANSKDILLAKNVDAGVSCILWDGKDGNGQFVEDCTGKVSFYVTYAGGLTHMPIYDVETNEKGFVVELVRPMSSSYHLALYWDDSDIPGYTNPPSDGCDGSLGCHKFPYFFGDSSTVNTWWYAVSDVVDTVEYFSKGVVLNDVQVKNQSCSYKSDGAIELVAGEGTPPFDYAIGAGGYQQSPLFENLKAGDYSVIVKDKNGCKQSRTVQIDVSTIIKAEFDMFQAGAYNDLGFFFTGEGGKNFLWDFGDGETSDEESPYHHFDVDTGYYVKLYTESGAPDYCEDSIVKFIEVYPSLQIFAPNAFTPNGDNLNDTFEIRGIAMHSYEIYVFHSSGAQVYYSNNIENSWDGRNAAGECERGVYAYVISAKDRKGKLHQSKGTVMLLK